MIDVISLIGLLVNSGVPEDDAKTLGCIAKFESQLNPKAINNKLNKNGTIDRGLFQINSANLTLCNVTADELFDIRKNTKCAVKVYKTQGLKAWYTLKFCKIEEV